MIDISRLPPEIAQSRRAVIWNLEQRDGKPTKVPYIPQRPSERAAVNNPATWGSFADAVSAAVDGKADGPGIVLGEGLIGIDLDGCRDAVTGAIDPSAQAIVDALNSYTEVSPSGRGLHVLVRGALPPGRRRKGKVEMYAEGRYFTCTGHHVDGTPTRIEERTAVLAELHARTLAPRDNGHQRRVPARPTVALDLDDTELLARARRARKGLKFGALMDGDTSAYASHSEADLALCNLLAFWTSADGARMDRLFRQSGLYRAKWDERHGATTYGELTINSALASCRETYQPQARRGERAQGPAAKSQNDGAAVEPVLDSRPTAGVDEGQPIPLGQQDPVTQRLVLSPRRTLPTAEAYVRACYQHADGRLLHSYAGLLLHWRDNCYRELEDDTLRSHLQTWLHAALRYVVNRRTGALELADFESNPLTVKAALESIRAYVHLPASVVSPSWLDGRSHPPALELLPCRSLNVHIPTRTIVPATPTFFTTSALDFDYSPAAPATPLWRTFLEQLWGDDVASIALLQEWFGYCLVPDTSQHKMLLLVGPRRSGKGTIGRLLTRLVGAANVSGPTTSSLAGPFGLQPLLGKSLAIVSDARFTGENVSIVVERLLCISGEDTLSIDRKFLGALSMRLPTRFMFLTNELPRLNDASTALAGRFLILRLTQSFYGVEDPTLTARLSTELPGILLWALDGWTRLQQRGYFQQPSSVADAIEDLEDLASPVRPFVRECCTVLPHLRVPLDTLYAAWEMWCQQTGRKASTRQMFGRDLASAVPGVKRRRGTADAPFYDGLAVTADTVAALQRFQRARHAQRELHE